MARVGSFENTAAEMGLCFTGTRIKKGSADSQNASFSFDPATMTCIACERSHPLFVEGVTACICISDQNFPANLSGVGAESGCTAVVRIEPASLLELVEIFCEIFAGKKIPAGTTVCIGSATHLHRAGATIYATDWVAVNHDFARLFPGTIVCPLIPIISDQFPGSLAVSIASLTAWYASIYESENRGLLPVWAEASKICCASAMSDSCNPDEKTNIVLAFPATLHPGAKLTARRIAVMGSCRGQAPPPPAKAKNDLICLLLKHLHTDFLIGYRPGADPVRTKNPLQQAKAQTKTAIIYGNSNMRQCVPALQGLGYNVIDRTNVIWDGSDNAIEALQKDVDAHAGIESAGFVFDFLSPIAYRFKQSDGSLALPVKLAGGYHLLGEAAVAEDSTIKNCVDRLSPVLVKMCRSPTVLIPPLPRFVFGGCCRAKHHAVGSGSDNAAKNMLSNIAHIRKRAKTDLQKAIGGDWWLADTLAKLGGDDGSDLKSVCAGDNVHFTGLGYAKIASEISDCFNKIAAKMQREPVKQQNFHWHGFTSPNGATGMRRDAGMQNISQGWRGQAKRGGGGRGAGRVGDHNISSRYNPYAR